MHLINTIFYKYNLKFLLSKLVIDINFKKTSYSINYNIKASLDSNFNSNNNSLYTSTKVKYILARL